MTTSTGATRARSLVDIGGASCFLSRPAGTVKAGLLLLPTYTGNDRFARDYADRLAELGFATLAWNPYLGTSDALPAEEARERVATLKDGACLEHLSICAGYLQDELRVPTIGTIGFCFGGRFSLLLAARDRRIAACVAVYPSIFSPKAAYHDEDAVAMAPTISAPVLLIAAGQDKVMTAEVRGPLSLALNDRSTPTAIVFFPEADHGFMHRPSPANDMATRLARPQINAFLEAHLLQ